MLFMFEFHVCVHFKGIKGNQVLDYDSLTSIWNASSIIVSADKVSCCRNVLHLKFTTAIESFGYFHKLTIYDFQWHFMTEQQTTVLNKLCITMLGCIVLHQKLAFKSRSHLFGANLSPAGV